MGMSGFVLDFMLRDHWYRNSSLYNFINVQLLNLFDKRRRFEFTKIRKRITFLDVLNVFLLNPKFINKNNPIKLGYPSFWIFYNLPKIMQPCVYKLWHIFYKRLHNPGSVGDHVCHIPPHSYHRSPRIYHIFPLKIYRLCS